MRFLLALLLSACLMLNAAFAAAAGICDTFEHDRGHSAKVVDVNHPGHHGHGLEHGPSIGDPLSGADKSGVSLTADHGHAHVHPSFSPITADSVSLPRLAARSPLVGSVVCALKSFAPALPERPPRALLA